MGDNKKDWGKVRKNIDDKVEEEMLQEDLEDEGHEEEHPAIDYPDRTALEEKLTLVEQQALENSEKYMRALAELDTMRRRAQEDVKKAHDFGNKKLLEDLLPVVDSLEQAAQSAEKSQDASMMEGLDLTMKLFLGVLEKFGVEQINPVGELFDPQLHEAISIQDAADAKPNTVLVVFQKGYSLNGRVIRPARVIVSKK